MAQSPANSEHLQRILEAYLEQLRPAGHIRPQLDIGGKIAGNSVEIFEIRPQWDNPSRIYRYPIAKATWQNGKSAWKVFCQSDDLTWREYSPKPLASSLEEFLQEVMDDRHGCF